MNESEGDAIFDAISSSITQILIVASNPDVNSKENVLEAQEKISTYEEKYWPMWVTALVFELWNKNKPDLSRQIAGIYFRRCLIPKNDDLDSMKMNWKGIDQKVKEAIKSNLLETMASSQNTIFCKIAAEGAAQVAFLDLSEWEDFLLIMHRWVISPPEGNEQVREAALVALSELCQEFAMRLGYDDTGIVMKNFQLIFEAVQMGFMTNIERLVLLSLKILQYLVYIGESVVSVISNFEGCIVQVLKWSESPNGNIKRAAFSCLIEFIEPLYGSLRGVIERIFLISSEIISRDCDEDNVKCAIEFWTSIAEYELDNPQPEGQEVTFKLLPYLSMFLACLERPQDLEDTWTVNAAASMFISCASSLLGETILGPVLEWYYGKICMEDENIRAGAIFAFGSTIVEGPKSENYLQYIYSVLIHLIGQISANASSPMVLYQVLWTFSRVAEFQPILFLYQNHEALLQPILEFLCTQAKCNNTLLASLACKTLYNLFQNLERTPRNPVNPYMESLMGTLVEVLNRKDGGSDNLLIVTFEAMISLIRVVPEDQGQLIEQTVMYLMPILIKSLESNTPDVHNIQGEICGVMCACIRNLGTGIIPVASEMMQTFFSLFKDSSSSSVHQEVLMAISAMISAIRQDFVKYIDPLMAYLCIVLTSYQDEELCKQATYVVSDLALILPEHFKNYGLRILEILMKDLNASSQGPLASKIIISLVDVVQCISDVEGFGEFLPVLIKILNHASGLITAESSSKADKYEISLINEWKEALLILCCTLLDMNLGVYTDQYQEIVLNLVMCTIRSPETTDTINNATCRLIVGFTKKFGQLSPQNKPDIRNFLDNRLKNKQVPMSLHDSVLKLRNSML